MPPARGDKQLLASSPSTRHNLEYTRQNPNELHYVLDGENHTGSGLWRKLVRQ